MRRKIMPGVISGNQELSCLRPEAMAQEAAALMRERVVGAVMVVDGGRLAGIVTERDLVFRLIAEGLDASATPIGAIMTKAPETLAPGDSVLDALEKMQSGRYRHLPVVDDGRICGMVSVRDLFAAARRSLEEDLHDAESLIHGEQYGFSQH